MFERWRGIERIGKLLPRTATVPLDLHAAAARTYQVYLDKGQLPSEHLWIIHLETRSLCNSKCAF